MFQFTYPAKIKKDAAGFFLVTFPDIPFAATDGKTMAEALEEARDCLEEAIAVSIADKLDFPFPSTIGKRHHAIPLTARMSAKAAFYIAVRETGIS
jgi:antitoxin HicB